MSEIPEKILIVDDEDAIRRALMRALGMLLPNSEFDEANSGSVAIEKIRAGTRYRLVTTDMNMANGNGIDFILQLRERDKETPVIMVASVKPEIKDAALRACASAFIDKPYTLDDLRGALRDLGILSE